MKMGLTNGRTSDTYSFEVFIKNLNVKSGAQHLLHVLKPNNLVDQKKNKNEGKYNVVAALNKWTVGHGAILVLVLLCWIKC